MSTPVEERKQILANTKRVVIKVGSQLLTGVAETPKQVRIEQLISQIALIRETGLEVILVSSGAIAAGMKLSEKSRRPTDVSKLQALAALGQSRLMSLYESACQQHGFHCAQILLSLDTVQYRKRHLNVRNCINTLLGEGILPIINENDAVSIDELCFGDNDRLAAMVGTMTRSDLTVLLTTVDGFHKRENGELTERMTLIHEITDDIRAMAGGTDGNAFSVGGMSTKLDAAELVTSAGEGLWIADGGDFSILKRIFDGDDVGTLFLPSSHQLSGSKRFLAFFAEPSGKIAIDDGAVAALTERGTSLLPSGITSVEGEFEMGDTVQIVDQTARVIAVGSSNYSAEVLSRIQGLRSQQIRELLHNQETYDEAVHRNNMSLIST